jgi:hypothetical protein
MSEMYRSFEHDFIKFTTAVRGRTGLLSSLSQGQPYTDQKELAVREGLVEASEADKCVRSMQLRQMEIETFMLPVDKRALMQGEVRKYRDEIDSLKRLLRKEEGVLSTIKNKETLMGSTGSVTPMSVVWRPHQRSLEGH